MLNPERIYFRFSIIITLLVLFFAGCKSKQEYSLRENNTNMNNIDIDSTFTLKERLGKLLFFDETLSSPAGQACVTCHDPNVAFADPELELPVSKGVHPGSYGNRNDMTISYSVFIPPLHFNKEEDVWIGGLFWDGRANSLAEQAKFPVFNPLEMANTDTTSFAQKLRTLNYSSLITDVYGADALSSPEETLNHFADAVEAFERTSEVSPFSSKYDMWLKGEIELSEQELRGLNIFEAEDKGNCAACHPSKNDDDSPPLFTDFTYDNLGVPKNPENPFYSLPTELNPDGFKFVDLGLGVTVNDPEQNGKFRVPTLRNIAVTSPYLHNGVYKTLFNVVAFYNTRDVADWPAAEVSENVNKEELGDLGLTNEEIEDLVVFLRTLTDERNKPNSN